MYDGIKDINKLLSIFIPTFHLSLNKAFDKAVTYYKKEDNIFVIVLILFKHVKYTISKLTADDS